MAASAHGSRGGQEYFRPQEGMQPGIHASCGPNSLQDHEAGSTLFPLITMNVKYHAMWLGNSQSQGAYLKLWGWARRPRSRSSGGSPGAQAQNLLRSPPWRLQRAAAAAWELLGWMPGDTQILMRQACQHSR